MDATSKDGLLRFRRLARDHTLVPVCREVATDLLTPVAAFWKLRRGAWSFLLESVEGGVRWARWTLMGTEPRAVWRIAGGEVVRSSPSEPGAPDERFRPEDPLRFVLGRFDRERVFVDPELPRLSAGLVGAVAYDAVRGMERLPDRHPPLQGVPDVVLLETATTLAWDNLRHRSVLVHLAPTSGPGGADARYDEAIEALDRAEARLAAPLPPLPPAPAGDREPEAVPSLSDEEFGRAVESAREYIAAGDAIQVVLSRRFRRPRAGVHPFQVYRALRRVNPSPYLFYLELGDVTLAGASPEVLVRKTDRRIETRPIAGTRRRGAGAEEDLALETELRNDPKEKAEHVMLVDLGRNDLGRVAVPGSVQVRDFMAVERYSHVMHLVSHVEAELRDDRDAADLVRAAFPAGTLSGAPKVRAMEIVEELEPERRGFYGGAVGMIGASGDVDLAITIRTLVATDETLEVQAGAGIVWDSVPEREAEETREKARAVLRALDEVRPLLRGSGGGG